MTMWILQAILLFVCTTEVTFAFSFGNRKSVVRTKRRVECRSLGHSIWSSWGPCYPTKDGMERRRYRLPRGFSFKSNVCSKKWDYEACIKSDIATADGSLKCEFSEWSDWDDCAYDPHSTLYTQQRHRIVKHTKEGGLKCSEVNLADFTESKECIYDCSWTAWTSCSKYWNQQRGVEFERYRIKKSKLHKNLYCPYIADYEVCRFCEWAAWTSWGPCVKDVAASQRQRRRERRYSNSSDGKLCSLLLEEDELDTEKCIPEDETTQNPNPDDREITQAATPVVKS